MNANRSIWSIALASITCLCTATAYCDDTTPSTPTPDPPLISASLGYIYNYQARTKQIPYNFSVLGKTILSNGTLPTFTDYSGASLADVSKYQYNVNIQNGGTAYGGSVLQAYSSTLLGSILPKLHVKNLSLVLGIDTQLESVSSSTYSYGLEYTGITFGTSTSNTVSGFFIPGFSGSKTYLGSQGTDEYGPIARAQISVPIYFPAKRKQERTLLRKALADPAKLDALSNSFRPKIVPAPAVPPSHPLQDQTDINHAVEHVLGRSLENLLQQHAAPPAPVPGAAPLSSEVAIAVQDAADAAAYKTALKSALQTTSAAYEHHPNLVIWADGNAR